MAQPAPQTSSQATLGAHAFSKCSRHCPPLPDPSRSPHHSLNLHTGTGTHRPFLKDALGLVCVLEAASHHPHLPPVPSSAEMMETFSRALKEFTVISPKSLLFDFFFLLISNSLKAIYLRAYQGPHFLMPLKTVRRTRAVGLGGRRRGRSEDSFIFFFSPSLSSIPEMKTQPDTGNLK